MSYTTTLHYVPKASWRSLSGSAQNRPVFESFRDDRLASVRVATGKGAAVEETVRKLVLTLPHARARSRPALVARGLCAAQPPYSTMVVHLLLAAFVRRSRRILMHSNTTQTLYQIQRAHIGHGYY